jgi:hypothetical protein
MVADHLKREECKREGGVLWENIMDLYADYAGKRAKNFF